METGTGPEPRIRFPSLVRAALLGVTVAAAVIAFATYEPQDIGRLYPPANIIANTWYGPVLVLLVPIAFGWLCLGISKTWLKVLALGLSVLLLLACVTWIYAVREQSGTVPDLIRREHVL
jgi:hypothetical protein